MAARRTYQFSAALILLLLIAIAGLLLWANNQRLQNEAKMAAAEAEAVAAEAKVVAAQADALAVQSTSEALVIETTMQAQLLAEATLQIEQTLTAMQVATSQAQSIARATADAEVAAAAVAATATIQHQDALATQAAIEAQATPTARSITGNQTPTPEPEAIAAQLSVDAQLKALVRPADNMQMLYITGFPFSMGAADDDTEADNDERPSHEVQLDNFYIDQFEVTVGQYAAFLNNIGGNRGTCGGNDCIETGFETQYSNLLNNFGFYEPKAGFELHPANWVSWYGANSYCEWAGARLPTEAEWEYAARGIDGRIYPWGDEEPTSDRAIFAFPQTDSGYASAFQPVHTLPPGGVSPFGVHGMAGHVWEWVQDWYDSAYFETNPGEAPNEDGATGLRVLRGGAWDSDAADLRSSNRFAAEPHIVLSRISDSLLYRSIGFRCAMDAE